MVDYQLYVTGSGGAVEAVMELAACDDDDAVAISSLMRSGHYRELWCGPRLVASWDPPARVAGTIAWARVSPSARGRSRLH